MNLNLKQIIISIVLVLLVSIPLGTATQFTYSSDITKKSSQFVPIISRPEPILFSSIPSTVFAIRSPATEYSNGLEWDGTYLWVSDANTSMIYQFDPFYNNILKSFHVSIPELRDIAYDGTNLWVVSWSERKVYGLNPETGEIITQFNTTFFSGRPNGLAWTGQYLLVGEERNAYVHFYDLTVSDTVPRRSISVDARNNYMNPRGLAWSMYANTVWGGYHISGFYRQHDQYTGNERGTVIWSPNGGSQEGLAVMNAYGHEFVWSTGSDNWIYLTVVR